MALPRNPSILREASMIRFVLQGSQGGRKGHLIERSFDPYLVILPRRVGLVKASLESNPAARSFSEREEMSHMQTFPSFRSHLSVTLPPLCGQELLTAAEAASQVKQ